MSELFLRIVNMSISASWLVLAVLLLRLVLTKAPKWASVVLWGLVAVRLICPFSFESVLSLIPSAETIAPEIMMDPVPQIHTGIDALNSAINPVLSQSFAPAPEASANPLQIWIPVAAAVWLLGVAAMLIYTGVTYFLLRRKVATAVRLRDNIFQSENVGSPFVLGILRPKIYLPFHMDAESLRHVVAHEQAHIRRKDHWWKPFGFLLLAVHWFNPLMWLGYVLLCRDIELSCDEKVIRQLDNQSKADYTQALVACSIRRRGIAACPLAFGEVGVKERVKSVMNYRKPTFWIILAAIVICIAVAVCFLTNPVVSVPEFELCEEHSMFVEYYEEDGIVHIVCTIAIENNTDYAGIVSLSALSQEDVDCGLLSTAELKAVNLDNNREYFALKAGQCNTVSVDFYGVYGGTLLKADRLIPDTIHVIWLDSTQMLPTGERIDEAESVEPVGQLPDAFRKIVENNLFYGVTAFDGRLLKAETCSRDEEGRPVADTVQMLDVYGNLLAEYTVSHENAYRVNTLTATEDGGFLFVLGFSDYYDYDQGTWASEKGFASRVIKCDKNGAVEFATAFDSVEGYALDYCFEKNGHFYFFGESQTPETRIQGVHSRTDIYMAVLDETGAVLKSKRIAGSDYDSLDIAEVSGNHFVLSVWSQSDDGDFSGSNSNGYPVDWVITVNGDLEITQKKKETGRNHFARRIGEKDGAPVYRSDPLLQDFDAGTPYTLVDYGDFYLIVSENITGIYENTPSTVSSIWHYTETVYSAYDRNGELIFRAAVDSSPDYDGYVGQMIGQATTAIP